MDVADTADLPLALEPALQETIEAMEEGQTPLFVGPPGVGKTMLARRITSIMPPLADFDRGILTERYRRIGMVGISAEVIERPFRAPHHSVSTPGLAGGGIRWRCGEAQLAQFGVLFLDELPEFALMALDALRHELRDVQVVASTTSCPCGWHASIVRRCTCSPKLIRSYRVRVEKMAALIGPCRRIDIASMSARDLKDCERCATSAQYGSRLRA